jgi:hemoglobin/transferrin/lactoferrin receptor protein
MHKKVVFSLSVIVIFGSGILFAAARGYGYDVLSSSEVKCFLSVSRTKEKAAEIPQAINVVTPKKIEERQSRTPAELLREEPSLWVQQTGSSGGAPIVRGQIGNRVLYLVDGVRLSQAPSGPNAYLNQVQEGAIDHVEVVRGPAAVQYGSDAIGGLIHIFTKQLYVFPEEPLYGGDITFRYGSVNGETTSMTNLWVATSRFNIIAGGTLQNMGDYSAGGDGGKLDNTSFKTRGYYGKFGYKLSADQTLTLAWQDNRREDCEQYGSSKINPITGLPGTFDPLQERAILKLDYDALWLTRWIRQFKSYVYTEEFKAISDSNRETSTLTNTTRTNTEQRMSGGGAQAETPLCLGFGEDQKLVYGIDYRLEDLSTTKTLLATTRSTGGLSVTTPQGKTPDGIYEVIDGFMLTECQFNDKWNVRLGGRYETSHLKSRPVAQDTVVPFSLQDLTLDKWWSAVTWSAGSLYWFTPEIGLSANVATGFRSPNYSDVLSYGVSYFSTRYVSIPSTNVKPEYSMTSEFGPKFVFDNWDASVSGYYTDLTDIISSNDTGMLLNVPGYGNLPAFAGMNVGGGYVYGVELTANYKFTRNFSAWLTYSEANSRDTVNNVPLRFIPPRNGGAGLRYEKHESRPYWVEGFVRVVDNKTSHNPTDESDTAFATDPGLGSPNTTNNPPLEPGFDLPGYVTATLRGGVQLINTGGITSTLMLSIENITDQRYREIFSRQLYDPGRNFVVSLVTKF